MKINWLLVGLTGSVFINECGKKGGTPNIDNQYGLPNATTNAAWTMGCLINNRPWIPKDSKIVGNLNYDSLIYVYGIQTGLFYEEFSINLRLNPNHFVLGVPAKLDSQYVTIWYSTDSTCLGGSFDVINSRGFNGSVTVSKLDTVAHIFSGTFEGFFAVPFCDTIRVTLGRFDVPY